MCVHSNTGRRCVSWDFCFSMCVSEGVSVCSLIYIILYIYHYPQVINVTIYLSILDTAWLMTHCTCRFINTTVSRYFMYRPSENYPYPFQWEAQTYGHPYLNTQTQTQCTNSLDSDLDTVKHFKSPLLILVYHYSLLHPPPSYNRFSHA